MDTLILKRYPLVMKNLFIPFLMIAIGSSSADMFAADLRRSAGSGSWKTLNNSWGWSIEYPADWNAYVMGSPEEQGPGPEIETGGNVNFAGPAGCFDAHQRCGLFQIAVRLIPKLNTTLIDSLRHQFRGE